MRRLLQLVCLFAAASAFAASPHDRIPLIKLEDGRELRNFEIVSFGTNVVMAKWEGGRGTVRFTELPKELRESLDRYRSKPTEYRPLAVPKATAAGPAATPEGATPKEQPLPVAGADPNVTILAGEAFISGGTSAGVQVKFTGLTIAALPLQAALDAFNTRTTPSLPPPLAKTVTNSEGQWTLKIPSNTPYLIHAHGIHYATKTGRSMPFEWRIPSTAILESTSIMLTDKNALDVGFIPLHRR